MLGAWAAGELAGSSGRSAGGALRIAAGSAGGAAIEDGTAALDASAGGLIAGAGNHSGGHHNGRLINRARAGLRHDHAADGQRGRRGCNRSSRGGWGSGFSGKNFGWG